MSWAKAAEVASQIVRPVRSAAIQSASGTRTPLVVPFQVKTTSLAGSIAAEVGRSRHSRRCGLSASSLSCLTTSVTQPAPKLSHASMVTGRGAEQRPHRQLHRAGVGRRDDPEPIVGGQAEQRVGALDRFLQPRLAERASGASGRASGVEQRRPTSRAAWRRGPTKR